MVTHTPVLLKESIDGLNLKQGITVVDATLGGGGHTKKILEKIMPGGKLVAIDRDEKAIENFKADKEIFLINDNYSNLDSILKRLGIEKVEAILADFGISSLQLEDVERGMSFQTEMPLDMRMNKTEELTAAEIVNEWSENDIARILIKYGEERFARRITRFILKERLKKPIKTTKELSDIVASAVPRKFQKSGRHPATKTFQALRIAVNKELEHIEKFLPKAVDALKKNGRLAIITFHSGEDRIVKNVFREYARGCICPPDFPTCLCGRKAEIKIIAKKPIVPGEEESASNPRSRSAKLRIAEKL